jgi:ketosteroid isomerase-like protein
MFFSDNDGTQPFRRCLEAIMTSHLYDPLPGFSALLRGALQDLAPEAHTFLQMLSDDAVMEFPFAPEGITRRLEGRAAVAEHLSSLSGMLDIDSFTSPVVYRDTEKGVTTMEFSCQGRAVQTGKPYSQDYISVITVRDGHIIHYRDYWNALVVLEALVPAGSEV